MTATHPDPAVDRRHRRAESAEPSDAMPVVDRHLLREKRRLQPQPDSTAARGPAPMKVCVIGASGKLGQYMVKHALARGYDVVGVCREASVGKLDAFKGRITVIAGATDDRDVIKRAVDGCDGVLTVLVPRGVHGYATGTAQAVLDHARPGARLVFSCGWHITRDGLDVYSGRGRAADASTLAGGSPRPPSV